jgi:hypothetical protein
MRPSICHTARKIGIWWEYYGSDLPSSGTIDQEIKFRCLEPSIVPMSIDAVSESTDIAPDKPEK